jgi:hypothetical protein
MLQVALKTFLSLIRFKRIQNGYLDPYTYLTQIGGKIFNLVNLANTKN